MANNPQKVSKFLTVLVILCMIVLLVLCALLFAMLRQDRLASAEASTPAASETADTAPTETAETVPETTEATEPPTQLPEETTIPEETTEPVETTEETTPTETETTAPPETTVPPETTAATEPPKDPLVSFLEQGNITFGDLESRNCSQLIVVSAEGSYADICFYSRSSGKWEEVTALSCSGRVGRSGVSSRKQESDGATPTGLYSIGSGFYIHSAPSTGLDLFQITKDTYWVDDPDSQFYNQKVEGTENKDWDSAEHMIDYSTYRYGFVVDYNLAAEYNAGSAIFFHIGSSSTAGCIATSENMVLAYLAQLDKTQNPHILILNGA